MQTTPDGIRYPGLADTTGIVPALATLAEDVQSALLNRDGALYSPNILINGDFRVNQRGFTSGGSIYPSAWAADRWVFSGDGSTATAAFTGAVGSRTATLTRGNGTLTLAYNRIEARDLPPGDYTVSWSGDMLGRAFPVGGSLPAAKTSPFTFTANGTSDYEIRFVSTAASATLANVKVERGAVATPFTPRPYAEELVLCRRYLQVFAGDTFGQYAGHYVTSASIHAVMPLMTPMRVAPTVTVTNGTDFWRAYRDVATGYDYFDTLGVVGAPSTTALWLGGSGNVSGTSGTPCIVLSNSASAKIVASAEL